jgi:hypothetical protein
MLAMCIIALQLHGRSGIVANVADVADVVV